MCEGTDPVGVQVNEARVLVEDLAYAIDLLIADGGLCPGNANLLSMELNVIAANSTLNDIVYITECAVIQSYWNDLSQDAFCDKIFLGFYIMWVCLYLILFFFIVLLMVVSILYKITHFLVLRHALTIQLKVMLILMEIIK
jgi:hypothetical protein